MAQDHLSRRANASRREQPRSEVLTWILALAMLGFAGCEPRSSPARSPPSNQTAAHQTAAPAQASEPVAAESAAPVTYDQAFEAMISAARLNVLLERAFAGIAAGQPVLDPIGQIPQPPKEQDSEAQTIADMLKLANQNLAEASVQITALRRAICLSEPDLPVSAGATAPDLVPPTPRPCGALQLPPLLALASDPHSQLARLTEDADALYKAADPLIAFACEKGVAQSKDPLFCSVE